MGLPEELPRSVQNTPVQRHLNAWDLLELPGKLSPSHASDWSGGTEGPRKGMDTLCSGWGSYHTPFASRWQRL